MTHDPANIPRRVGRTQLGRARDIGDEPDSRDRTAPVMGGPSGARAAASDIARCERETASTVIVLTRLHDVPLSRLAAQWGYEEQTLRARRRRAEAHLAASIT